MTKLTNDVANRQNKQNVSFFEAFKFTVNADHRHQRNYLKVEKSTGLVNFKISINQYSTLKFRVSKGLGPHKNILTRYIKEKWKKLFSGKFVHDQVHSVNRVEQVLF